MRRIFVGTGSCGTEKLSYYLLAEDVGEAVENYGVQVDGLGETAAIRCVTLSQVHAQTLADSLMRNGVTPISIRDVVDDWLLR